MDDAIRLDRVSKNLGQRQVLKDVSFIVQKGDIFGYLGPNGAGKTTTIRVILGLMNATSGKTSILGRDVRQDNVRQKIGFVLEVDGLYDNLTAYDNLRYYSQIYEVSDAPQKIDRAIFRRGAVA